MLLTVPPTIPPLGACQGGGQHLSMQTHAQMFAAASCTAAQASKEPRHPSAGEQTDSGVSTRWALLSNIKEPHEPLQTPSMPWGAKEGWDKSTECVSPFTGTSSTGKTNPQ